MGFKADLLNNYRKAVKAGSYVGTFNEYTGGKYSERGGATAARLENKALTEAGADISAQIRAAGGDPSRMSLQEMQSLNINALAANQARATATVTAGQSAQDVAASAGITLDDLLAQNPATFGMTSPNSITDTSVFAGQRLNTAPLADRVAEANRSLAGGRGTAVPTAADYANRAASQRQASLVGRGTAVPTGRSVTGGRGTAVPTATDFAARTQQQAQTNTGRIPGLPYAAGISSQAAQRSANEVVRASSGVNKAVDTGRISNAQLRAMGGVGVMTGTIEEILSRNPGTKEDVVDTLVDAFGSKNFIDTIGSFETSDWPTKIGEKSFRSLLEMMPPEMAQELRNSYAQNFLIAGDRAYYPVLDYDPANTEGGATGGGGSTYVDTNGIKRSIKSIIRRGPGGGGGVPGTNNTSNGFTPTARAIMWRI